MERNGIGVRLVLCSLLLVSCDMATGKDENDGEVKIEQALQVVQEWIDAWQYISQKHRKEASELVKQTFDEMISLNVRFQDQID